MVWPPPIVFEGRFLTSLGLFCELSHSQYRIAERVITNAAATFPAEYLLTSGRYVKIYYFSCPRCFARGPNLYYYEVVECGRRILLTEVLIFIAPQSAKQAAMACIFAFVSLLGFELLRPHVEPTGLWLYRLVSRDKCFGTTISGKPNTH